MEIVESLIFQLASRDENLKSFITEEIRGNHLRTMHNTVQLFQKILDLSGTTYLVMDGLDETDAAERGRLLSELLRLSKDCDHLRILVSSRPESDLMSLLQNNAKHIIVHKKNSNSISAFVQHWTNSWFEDRHFGSEVEDEIRGHLSPLPSKAAGRLPPFPLLVFYCSNNTE